MCNAAYALYMPGHDLSALELHHCQALVTIWKPVTVIRYSSVDDFINVHAAAPQEDLMMVVVTG